MKFHQPPPSAIRTTVAVVAGAAVLAGCADWPDQAPQTSVVVNNNYAASASDALVIYDAYWMDVSFAGNPIAPGASSAPLTAYPTSGDTAYVVIAPGWDPSSGTPPTSFTVMQSRSSYALALGSTLKISVDDTAFEGNCASGSALTQPQADFLTQIVFASDFAGVTYDAATCTATAVNDAGAGGDAGAD